MTRSCGAGVTLCGTGGDGHGDVICGIRIADEFLGLHVAAPGGKIGPGRSGLGPAGWRAAAPRAGCAGLRSAGGVRLRPVSLAAWLQNPLARRSAGGVWKPRLRLAPCSAALARASRFQGPHRAPCLATTCVDESKLRFQMASLPPAPPPPKVLGVYRDASREHHVRGYMSIAVAATERRPAATLLPGRQSTQTDNAGH
jgi:hypothetical protein